jgi:hypothetical protein
MLVFQRRFEDERKKEGLMTHSCFGEANAMRLYMQCDMIRDLLMLARSVAYSRCLRREIGNCKMNRDNDLTRMKDEVELFNQLSRFPKRVSAFNGFEHFVQQSWSQDNQKHSNTCTHGTVRHAGQHKLQQMFDIHNASYPNHAEPQSNRLTVSSKG